MRLATLLTVLALLVAAPAALAQDGNPFNGIPPAQPAPAPTVEPTQDTAGNNQSDRQTLFLIGAALLVVFVGIGVWIARDARSNLPADERERLDRRRDEMAHKHERQAKAKARAKGRAQRRARKTTRKKTRR